LASTCAHRAQAQYWYVKALPGGEDFRARMNLIED
jgi:hypothetical protein